MALLGAISNNRRPHYSHYPNYPPHYPTPASSAYPSYAHSPYLIPSQPLHPTYAQPAYPTYASPAYPNNYGGYRPGYPFGRSQDFALEESDKDQFENEPISLAENMPSLEKVNGNDYEDKKVLSKDENSIPTELEDEA